MSVGAADLPDYHGWKKAYRDWLRLNAEGLSNIVHTAKGSLHIVDGLEILDRSEKAFIRYWMGVGIARLMAERHLGVRWLIWVDRIGPNKNIRTVRLTKATTLTGKQVKTSPDFIGKDRSGEWHVLEAKGRGQALGSAESNSAKNQAQSIVAINRAAPMTRSVCSTVIYQDRTEVEWTDPEIGHEFEPREVVFSDEELFLSYYAGIRAILGEAESEQSTRVVRHGLEFKCAPLGLKNSSLWIGIPRLIEADPVEAIEACRDLPFENDLPDYNEIVESIGPDGIMVTKGQPK